MQIPNKSVHLIKVPAPSTQTLIHIQEPGLQRIIDLNNICAATKFDDSTIHVYLRNRDEPWVFRYGAAEKLWQILMEGSTNVYCSPELAKNPE